MNKGFARRRTTRHLAVILASIVSGCAQAGLLGASTSFAAVPEQKHSTPRQDSSAQTSQTDDDTSFTRPRRAESQTGGVKGFASTNGPIIRIALMTDVTSVSLTSSYRMIVRRRERRTEDGKEVESGSLRVDLRQQGEPSSAVESKPVYAVRVATSSEARRARKLTDELKKKFFEPITTAFDERQKEYSVLIGKFATRSEATRLAARLRVAGYDEPQIVTATPKTSESADDTTARASNYKARPSSIADNSSGSKAGRHPLRLVALFADKRSVSSEEELIVSPLETSSKEKGGEPTVSARVDENKRPPKHSDRDNSADAGARVAPPASVRVAGKDYRGEMHLVLNPRGRINVVNSLPLEEYLRGVVPVELSPGQYPELEALKAQAVAARSYALARLGQHRDEGFDLVDDTRAQVYGGLSVERELSNRAVEETRGVVAAYPVEDGKLVPIEALYTANCGGRTENNEEVFGGTPLPYLRGVSCSPDEPSVAAREITTRRAVDPLTGTEGRSLAREVGLLSVLGFSIPRRVTGQYLRSSPDQDEVRSWVEQINRLSRNEKRRFPPGDSTRLVEFLHLVATSFYGEGRAGTLLAPADVDYVLGGLPVRELPREARADVAMLLRDGILHLTGSGAIDWRAIITRGQALEIVARGVSSKLPLVDLRAQTTNSLSLKSEIAAGTLKGHLMIASAQIPAPRTPGSRYQSVNTAASGRPPRAEQDGDAEGRSARAAATTVTHAKTTAQESQLTIPPGGIEIADDAWLFRKLGDVSYAVPRLTLIGGERVTYHLNAAGRIDFLEAMISDRGAASDRFSSVAQWQERVPVEDIRQRLAGARINVGNIDNIEPVAFSSSNRVTEVEITGDKGRARLGRPQIRSAFGVKEYIFVVDREIDADGHVVAFVFTGRGWGHGVGMCQVGAYGLAKDGYSYAKILQKYYTGIRLQKMY
ncbi:MAG TPA: SpoIID/LytB domain-containing protein [Blastocatellia bacterium]|nr:SpoIID/LytB domain-containing protein [Blastocatellia bacterium]